MTTDPKPCPWCGSTNTDSSGFAAVLEDGTSELLNGAWGCEDCGASGPYKDGEAEAVEAWNQVRSRQDFTIEHGERLAAELEARDKEIVAELRRRAAKAGITRGVMLSGMADDIEQGKI